VFIGYLILIISLGREIRRSDARSAGFAEVSIGSLPADQRPLLRQLRHYCSAQRSDVKGQWQALPADEKPRRRAERLQHSYARNIHLSIMALTLAPRASKANGFVSMSMPGSKKSPRTAAFSA
jgi:hypothetical protein